MSVVAKTHVSSSSLGYKHLVSRLIECQYEITDKFTHYLSNTKPDHSMGMHILIPAQGPRSQPRSMENLRKVI